MSGPGSALPESPSVSIVIPTYSRRRLLEQTVHSLTRQSYPAPLIELVVVDDCSDDDTARYLAEVELPFRLVSVRHELNRGRAAARNTAVRAASGDLIVFVDDDMRCDVRLVEEHVRCQLDHEGAIVIGSAVQAPELGRSTAMTYLDEMGVHKLRAGSRAPAKYFVTNNSSVPRQPILDVGCFDETFRNYGFEDTELAFRLEDAGLETWFCAEARSWHLDPQSFDQILDKRLENVEPLRYLLTRHPHRAGEMLLDPLLPISRNDSASLRLRKLMVLIATNRAFYALVRRVARAVWLRRLSLPVMTYLIACQYRRGLAAGAASRSLAAVRKGDARPRAESDR